MDNEYSSIMASRTTEELQLILTKYSADYDTEALSAARSELESRGEKVREPRRPGWQRIEGDRICTDCKQRFTPTKKITRTLLGFSTMNCTHCGKKVTYPLSTTYVIIYLVLIALFAVVGLPALLSGNFPAPGILVIAGLIAIVKNGEIHKQVKQAERECRELEEDAYQ